MRERVMLPRTFQRNFYNRFELMFIRILQNLEEREDSHEYSILVGIL